MNKLVLISLLSIQIMASNDNMLLHRVAVEKLQIDKNKNKSWNGHAWVGNELNKIYLYVEGEKENNEKASYMNQLVLSRAILPYWDIQVGVAQEYMSGTKHNWGVVALSGLAPYFFESRALFMFDKDGAAALKLNTSYDALITQKLIFSPDAEVKFYTKDMIDQGVGKGLSSVALGLSLRYEVKREFAPYIGVEYDKNFGNTKDINPINDIKGVVGIRFWF